MNCASLVSPRIALLASAAALAGACSQTALRQPTAPLTASTIGPAAPVATTSIVLARAVANNPAPVYPHHLRRTETNGLVHVEAIVDETGRVLAANVVSSTHPDFNRPTLDAVRRWKFEPRMVSGVPVISRVIVPVEFAMEEEPGQAKVPRA